MHLINAHLSYPSIVTERIRWKPYQSVLLNSIAIVLFVSLSYVLSITQVFFNHIFLVFHWTFYPYYLILILIVAGFVFG